jgi:hypothetical protein
MRTVLRVVALVVMAVAVWRLAAMSSLLRQQDQQIQQLTNALSQRARDDALAGQTRCAEIARRYLSSRGFQTDGANGYTADYQNHFNSKLKKCFVLVTSYLPNQDFVSIDLFDAIEGKRYAQFNGHNICDVAITSSPRKCFADSGRLWFDGNDQRVPADLTVGFRGLKFGPETGDEKTLSAFRDHIHPFMTE